MEISKQYKTETGHRLINYSGKCAHIHGHSYKWFITIESPDLDAIGFIMDFKDLKDIIKNILEPLDHAFLAHEDDHLI